MVLFILNLGENMELRLGYVGNSVFVENCPVNKTVSVMALNKLPTYEKKIQKLIKVARENLNNTLQILESNKSLGIQVYGISPKLFPLPNYPDLEYFNYIDDLKPELEAVGKVLKENQVRANIHLETGFILASLSEKVFVDAMKELKYQNTVLEYMGLDETYKIVVNIGGMYFQRNGSFERLAEIFEKLDARLRHRLVIENEDRSISTEKLLQLCKKFSIPFFMDAAQQTDEGTLTKAYESWENSKVPPLLGFANGLNQLKERKMDELWSALNSSLEMTGDSDIILK